jgi:predicted ATPase
MAMLDLESHRLIARWWALAPGVGMLTDQKSAWWMLGFPERCMENSQRCFAFAQEVGHPPSMGYALTCRTAALCMLGDAQSMLAASDEALRLVREERLGFWEPILNIHRGWALAEMGDPQGLAHTRSGLDRYKATGSGVEQTRFYSILASLLWRAGEWDQAFHTLENAMILARENGEGYYEPELYRLRGEFLFEQATGRAPAPKTGADRDEQIVEAERCIRESIERARRQEAKMLQLRSLVSLCRLRSERDALAELYSTFTEGFETPDLRAAQTTLAAGC